MPQTEVWFMVVLVVGWSQAGHGSPSEYEPVTYHPATYKTYKDTHGHQDTEPKYDYEYAVRNDNYGPTFGAAETRDGYDTKGSYFVDLPDGRRQTVTYYVSKDSGFVADVTYEYTGKGHGYTPQKNLAKGYRKPDPTYDETRHPVYQQQAEPNYNFFDGATYFQSEPHYKSSQTVFPSSQQNYLHSDQIYQTSEPGYQISELNHQASEPNFRNHDSSFQRLGLHNLENVPAFQTSGQNFQISNQNYHVPFASQRFISNSGPQIGTSQGPNNQQSSGTFQESPSKFDGSHLKPLKLRRTYQEIPAPKPVLVSPEYFSKAQGGEREHQQVSPNLNDLYSRSLNQKHKGESQGTLRLTFPQATNSQSFGSLPQIQIANGGYQGSLKQVQGVRDESQRFVFQAQGAHGESQGSLPEYTLQETGNEAQDSTNQGHGIQEESQGSLQHGSQQGNQAALHLFLKQSSPQVNRNGSQAFVNQASPRVNFGISPEEFHQSSDQGNYQFETVNYYPSGGSSMKPTGENYAKPPKAKTIREIEQYNIDAAEYI